MKYATKSRRVSESQMCPSLTKHLPTICKADNRSIPLWKRKRDLRAFRFIRVHEKTTVCIHSCLNRQVENTLAPSQRHCNACWVRPNTSIYSNECLCVTILFTFANVSADTVISELASGYNFQSGLSWRPLITMIIIVHPYGVVTSILAFLNIYLRLSLCWRHHKRQRLHRQRWSIHKDIICETFLADKL